MPPWNADLEPNQQNIRTWLDNLRAKFQPAEQSRWNQANIDSLFYAGCHEYINKFFNTNTNFNIHKFYFNLLQQPVNLCTGYQRQHRKEINYIPDGSPNDNDEQYQTTDQYTKIMTKVCNKGGIHEQFSRGCEQSAITGLVLLQPYLDFTTDDQSQGDLKLKLWEYNSFMIDPYCRDFAEGSDCNHVWCQEYISKSEAEERFPEAKENIKIMTATVPKYGSFYFLPENHNMLRNNLLIVSYVWYKWKRKKKRLYSRSTNQYFDFFPGQENLDEILYKIPDLEEVEVNVPTWKLAVILNDQLMYQGENPLQSDLFPFQMMVWNYEPHINYPDLRVRSLVRTMRDANYLMNRRIVINHSQAESSINTGWKRKVGAVANEDNLKRVGEGYDVLVNKGFELADVEKIQPNIVPESNMALAEQLKQLIFSVSGVDLENWSAQEDSQASTLTVLMKQAANLMVLQKYFDQWDLALKMLGKLMLDIILNNWNVHKIRLLLGEEPSQYFYSKIFCKYQVVVEEGILTPTQSYQEYRQWLELNEHLGGIIPADKIAAKAPIQGKKELMQILKDINEQQAHVQEQNTAFEHAKMDAQLKESYSKSANYLANAHERHSRSDSNEGLKEERISEVAKNHAMALKERMAALKELMDVAKKYGDLETKIKQLELDKVEDRQELKEDVSEEHSRSEAEGTKFIAELMSGMMQNPQEQSQPQGEMQQPGGETDFIQQ